MGESVQKQVTSNPTMDICSFAVDELNLAEFPLALLSDRQPEGKNTVSFEEEIFDRVERKLVARKVVLSGSQQFGLPTAMYDDVLLACIQLAKQQGFASRELIFSRYEILKLLRLADESKNYARVEISLRRWKGLTIYSERAFYDFAAKSWVNRDFSLIDNLYLYRREQIGKRMQSRSRLVWNEVMHDSFTSGYLKQLDWNLYLNLSSSIAKRLYRFLDKRFYHSRRFEINLNELATNRLGLSTNYNTGQIKRLLDRAIAELESKWLIKECGKSSRYVRHAKGNWTIVFETKKSPRLQSDKRPEQIELEKRSVSERMARSLIEISRPEVIQQMIDLYDWYNSQDKPRGAGFLIQSIKNPNNIQIPRNFEPPLKRVSSSGLTHLNNSRICRKRKLNSQTRVKACREENTVTKAFTVFWESLTVPERDQFIAESVARATPEFKEGYKRATIQGGKLLELYTMKLTMDHFNRRQENHSEK